MTLPNERLLVGETQLDQAMQKTFELMKAREPTEIQRLAETLGVAAIRQAHLWAVENAKAQFGANVMWQRDTKMVSEFRLQFQEIQQLAFAMGNASAREQITVIGELLDVSFHEKTFKMDVDKNIISGSFDGAISYTRPVQLPRAYRATLNVSRKIAVADEQEEISYFLVSLGDPAEGPLGFLAERTSR